MDTTMLHRMGLVETPGADVFGGDIISPALVWFAKMLAPIVTAAVVANWADFKDGIFEGYNDATH